MNSLHAAAIFLTNTFASLYLSILMVRLILVYVGANYFNPLTQFVVKLTDGLIRPLRRGIRNIGPIETATLLVIFVFGILKFSIMSLLLKGDWHPVGILLLTLGDSVTLLVNCFFYAIIAQMILSWIQPYSPINQTLRQFISPLINPISRFIPPIAGFDISPLIAIVILQLVSILLASPLLSAGWDKVF